MIFQRKTKNSGFSHLGYRKKIMPIIEKAMADFIVRISVNSSYVVLGIYDIATEGFYRHNMPDFLDQIPEHLSYPSEFSPYLKPFVSDRFKNIVNSYIHELLIGSFFKYYLVRLPVLVHHGRYSDWPKNKGVSEDDLSKIVPYTTVKFEDYFPNASRKIRGKGPNDKESILYQYPEGLEMASKHKLKDKEMVDFLYRHEAILQDIIEMIPELEKQWNVLSFFANCFNYSFKQFWDSYYLDYMNTLRDWSISGAFEGDERFVSEYFWADLDKRLDRHEFLIRTAESY